MKNKYLLVGFIFLHIAAHAQMKIGNNSTNINDAALLELETTNQGLVFPRISLSSISSSSPLPADLLAGTVVYNTNASITNGNGVGLYSWNGSVWVAITPSISAAAWSLTGNSGTSASTNFIGTTDGIDFVGKTNNVERMRILGAASGGSKAGWIGMGVTIPRSSLDVTGNYTNKNVITIQNTSSTGYSSVDMLDNSGTLKGTFGYGNSGTGSFFGSRDYFSTYGSDFVLNANSGNYNFFMSGSNGNIGFGTATPSATIDVNGNFKLGSSGTVLTNVYKTSVSITIPSSALGLFSVSKTVAVSNAPLNSSVIINPRSALPAGVNIAYSYVSSANNVTVNFTGLLAVVAATAVTFDITVLY